jgi:ubiquinone/menaquinone biosynthesis C-methylase UbiE
MTSTAIGNPSRGLESARPVKEFVREYWGARAASFDEGDSFVSRTPDLADGWRAVFSEAFGPPALDVLDVGSGTGELALLFDSMGHRARGVDLAPQMVDRAREKAARRGVDIRFDLGDAESLPFRDESLDVVHARHVIQLLPNPSRAIAEWMRVLRPGGVVFVASCREDSSADSLLERVQRRVGRAILVAFHALGIDRRPIAPPKHGGTPWDAALPFRRGLAAAEMREFLTACGLESVETRDLTPLRARGHAAMVWYRRWANGRKRDYSVAWGRKPLGDNDRRTS